MSDNIDLKEYSEFVDKVTSEESKDSTAFRQRLDDLGNGDVPRLLTAALGLSAESGEFTEIVKKLVFQGKPLTDETKAHMIKELGDVVWYWTQGCMALGVNPNDVINTNKEKLMARYPEGEFSSIRSENREEGDI
jgi:NTP pyrophosphatase (non-canonical NTP hydrolase)